MKQILKEFSNFFKFIGGLVVTILGFALYIFFQKKQDEKLEKEIKEKKDSITRNEGVIDFNDKNILKLEEIENEVENNIKEIEGEENNEDLNEFFNKRGF